MKATGTETSEGFIPHIDIMFDGGILKAPVKLALNEKNKGGGIRMREIHGRQKLPVPKRYGTGLVYALPCGYEFVK